MQHVLAIGEMHKNMRERDNWEGTDVDETIKMKLIFKM